MSSLLRQVQATVREHALLPPGTGVVVGVSGGADSVTLLHVLAELAPSSDLRLVVAHLDHGLRGKRAREDLAFVREVAGRHDLCFEAGRADVRRRARRKGISIEMAAREARYDFYRRTCRRTGATHVATGHTADDQAETFLLKLVRGAGATGLSAIPYRMERGNITVVRPLLDVGRESVLRYLRRRGLPWSEDETNRDLTILRNRVRHEVLPLLADRLNPRVRDVLVRTADLLRAEDAWLEQLSARALRDCLLGGKAPDATGPSLNVAALREQPRAARRRVLRQWLRLCEVPPAGAGGPAVKRLEELLRSTRGTRSVPLAEGYTVRRDYGRLSVAGAGAAAAGFDVRLPLPGEVVMPELGWRVTARAGQGPVPSRRTKPGVLPAQAGFLRGSIGRRKMTVRSRRPGDRMLPAGLGGSRKLQDIFVDGKVPRHARDRVPVFECGGRIVWVPGYRVAEGWAARDSRDRAWHVTVEQV